MGEVSTGTASTKPAYGRRRAAIHSGWHSPHGSYISLSWHPWGFNWHGSIGPNGSTGSASRYRRPAKLGDDTALTGQSPQQWLASRGIFSWKLRGSRPQPAPISPPSLPDQMGISLSGYLLPDRVMALPHGIWAIPGVHRHPHGGRRISTLVETGCCPTGQRPP